MNTICQVILWKSKKTVYFFLGTCTDKIAEDFFGVKKAHKSIIIGVINDYIFPSPLQFFFNTFVGAP